MEKHSRTILVPIDSNDQAIIALSQSYNLARLTKSKIVLLSIDEGNSPNIKTRLADLAKEAEVAIGQKVQTMIRKGDVYQEIEKVADEIKPAFVMMGIKKVEGGKYRGKNALEMIRKSKHAIISIGGKEHRDGCKKILMPLDLTVLSREKLVRTVEVAKLFHSSINIISVLNKESKLEENKLHMYANQCIKYIKENELNASAKFIRSNEDVASVVIEYGKKIQADLIVIINDGDRSVKEFFTGTAAQRLINNSDIPVLTLRPIERRDMTQAIF